MTVAVGAGTGRQVARALERGARRLLALQHGGGWWKGDLETNVTIDAEDLLLRQFLGIRTEERTKGAAAWIRSKQREDGTWATFHGGPPDLSTTVEAYAALRLAGDPADAGHMRAAAGFVREAGGLGRSRVFTRMWLALSGLWEWEDLPVLPPEMILLPSWFPLNIYDFGCWARQTIVPLTIVSSLRPGPTARAAQHLGRPLPAARPVAARLPPAPAPAAAPAGRAPRRPLDRRATGGGRLLGRDPAAVGVLHRGAAPARLSPGPSGAAGGACGAGGLHGRRRPLRVAGGLPVAGVGHRAGGDRARGRGPAARSPGAGARGRVAARRRGAPPRRLGRAAAGPRSGRLGVRVRQRQLPRRRRHRRGGAGAAAGRPPGRRAPPGRARPRGRLGDRHAERQWRLGGVRCRQRQHPPAQAAVLRLRRGHRPALGRRHRPRDRDAGRRRAAALPSRPPWPGLAAAAAGAGRLLVRSLGRQLRLRHGRGPARAGGRRDRPASGRGAARRALARRAPEPGRRLGRGPALLPGARVARPWRLDRLADGLGPARPDLRRRARLRGRGAGSGLARRHAARGRLLGRAVLHGHRLPRRLLHQLSPVPDGLPGHV